MQFNTLIVDDEPLARARMQRLLADLPSVSVVGEAKNGLEAIEMAAHLQPDLIFMDIQMPHKTGLEAAAEILDNPSDLLGGKPPSIIFCTAYDQYAIDAFKLSAADYLLKPVSKDDLHKAIDKAGQLTQVQLSTLLNSGQGGSNSLTIKRDNVSEKLSVDQVIYFRSEGKHVVAGLENGNETVVDFTLKELESRFQQPLLRVHRNTLVNCRKVKRLIRNQNGQDLLELEGCDQLFSVSRRSLAEVKKCFE